MKNKDLILIIGNPPLTEREEKHIHLLCDQYNSISINHHHHIRTGKADYILFHDYPNANMYLSNPVFKDVKLITQEIVNEDQKDRFYFLYARTPQGPAAGKDKKLFFLLDSMIPAIDFACYLGFKKALLVLSNRQYYKNFQALIRRSVCKFKPYIRLYKYREECNFDLPALSLEELLTRQWKVFCK